MAARVVSAFDNGENIDECAIKEAVQCLTSGELVAFPTETVYGLGANALDEAATSKIFEAKGRPASNPLIVHVASIDQARQLVCDWPQQAQQLAEAFWPGPLTLVLRKTSIVPDKVTAGGSTVALRIPCHPVALALIKACGCPLAAPSANRSNQLSPTTAEHVARGMGDLVPLILDGGPCESGIESTVLNLTGPKPEILRPGVLSANFLSEVLGIKVVLASQETSATSEPKLSPGQLSTHYAPRTQLVLVQTNALGGAVANLVQEGKRVGLMAINEPPTNNLPAGQLHLAAMSSNPDNYARQLYATLHTFDEQNLDVIVCEIPPATPEWAGIQDRLTRAGRFLPR